MRLFITTILFTAFSSVSVFGQSVDSQPMKVVQRLAETAGIDSFSSVETLTYTFNARIGDRTVKRTWTWKPHLNEVILHGTTESKVIQYSRTDLEVGSEGSLSETDHKFVNDLYWLIFPFQVVWDSTVAVEALPSEAAQVFPEAHAGVRVRYPDEGGYTPGDVYDLFYGKDDQITHWVFRKGGSTTPSRTNYWRDYQAFGPLKLSLNRPSPDPEFRIWFTDVSISTDLNK